MPLTPDMGGSWTSSVLHKSQVRGHRSCMDPVHFPQSGLDGGALATRQRTDFLKFCFVASILKFGWALRILVLARRRRCCWCATVALVTRQRAISFDFCLPALILPLSCAFLMFIFAFWRRCRRLCHWCRWARGTSLWDALVNVEYLINVTLG